jgi:hypothetical protein
MKKENLFYLIFLFTILIVRLSIIIFPGREVLFLVHHFWIGFILLLILLIIPKKYKFPRILFLAMGIGLIADELVFIILGAGGDKEYWALPSIAGTIILMSIIYLSRLNLISLLYNKKKRGR